MNALCVRRRAIFTQDIRNIRVPCNLRQFLPLIVIEDDGLDVDLFVRYSFLASILD